MISWHESDSLVLASGCFKMQIARSTWPTTLTLLVKYDGSPMMNLALVSNSTLSSPLAMVALMPTTLPSSYCTSLISVFSMYVPP